MPAIEIPELVGFRSKVFNIGHNQQLSPTGQAGFIQTLNRTSPLWYAQYETPGLRGVRYNETRAFLDSLEGSMNTFLAYDPRRIKPAAYLDQPFLSTPWGSPQITSQNYANSTINIGSITSGAIITKGDYIATQVGVIWYLFRSMENRVAVSGAVSALIVKPRPQIIDFVASAIRYHKPCIEMKIMGEIEEMDTVDDLPSFRFSAGQYTNRVPE